MSPRADAGGAGAPAPHPSPPRAAPDARAAEGCGCWRVQPRAAVGVSQKYPAKRVYCQKPATSSAVMCLAETCQFWEIEEGAGSVAAGLGEGEVQGHRVVYFVTRTPSVYVQLASPCIWKIVWLFVPHIAGYTYISEANCNSVLSLVYSCPPMQPCFST